ncbi:unnamed protein product [Prunus brigantina]
MALKFIFTAIVFFNEQGLHMQSALCNYILIMEATTIGIPAIYYPTLFSMLHASVVFSTSVDGKIKIWLYDSFEGSAVPNWLIVLMFKGELKPGQKEDLELPLFDLAAVVCATKNFSNNNELGEANFAFRVNFFNFGLQTFSQSQRLGGPPRWVGSFSGAEQGGRSSRNLTASASSVLCECTLSCLFQMYSKGIAVRLYT